MQRAKHVITKHTTKILSVAAGALLVFGIGMSVATATAPCGDFGECKTLVEINATDGDIGFHFLVDGDDLLSVELVDPRGRKVFEKKAKGALRQQRFTETFGESTEPLCAPDPADPDAEVVTLEEFLERWADGTYVFTGKGPGGEKLTGETQLTYALPAAPTAVNFNVATRVISWAAGTDLGKCASSAALTALVAEGVLPVHPQNVPVAAWEIVLEPDVEAGNPVAKLKFTIRVAGTIAPTQVIVPAEYLTSLPADTPLKVEVGAIGVDDNATFTEADGFCNQVGGC
jgi:hypothetical protein